MGQEITGTDSVITDNAASTAGRPNNPQNGTTEGGTAQSGTDSSGTGTKTTSEIEILGGLAAGIEEIPTPKRGRGRPKGSTKSGQPNVTTTTTKKTVKSTDEEQTRVMVATMLMVGFDITARRAGNHWRLTQAEADAIAEPVAAIMQRHNLTEATGKYGDYFALLAAVAMIMVPKVLTTLDINKKKGGMHLVQQPSKPIQPVGGKPSPSNGNAGKVDGNNQPVQPSSTDYGTSNIGQSLAWIGG